MPDEISEFLGEVDAEFAGVDLGDARREARLRQIVQRVAARPDESFPRLVSSIAEREALYRLLNNDAVEWEAIAAPHFAASAARGAEQGLTRVVHDTTDFVFPGDREGMGTVIQSTKGFFAHVALAVSGGEQRIPLGVVGMKPFVRNAPPIDELNERKLEVRKRPRAKKESSRWESLASTTNGLFPEGSDVIHVMDQEADDYTLLAELRQAKLRFVIRGASTRLLERRGGSIGEALETAPAEAFRTVPLSKRDADRSAKNRKAHPPRRERTANLHLRWTRIELKRPQHAQSSVDALELDVVQVFEPDPPAGEEAISWTLLTSERVDDAESAAAIVDHYRARWRIEEYFRALKQGCAVQKRQLESLDAMLCALAIFLPVAWRLLLLRSLGQDETPYPAAAVFDEAELAAVDILLAHHKCKPLRPEPSIRDFMLAVAQVGGHIRNNGEPGWLVLGRGYADVLLAAAVWRAARVKM